MLPRLRATRHNFRPDTRDGTNLDYAMLPKKLRAAGYRSYHLAKWHQAREEPCCALTILRH